MSGNFSPIFFHVYPTVTFPEKILFLSTSSRDLRIHIESDQFQIGGIERRECSLQIDGT